MKKFFLTLGVAALALSSYAGTRILYQQNFETAETVEATGWTYGASASIASDEYGKFLELNNNGGNGRSGFVKWGNAIFTNEAGESVLEDGTYTAKFDFSIKTNSNNQYNSEITLFTNNDGVSNQPYRGRWSGDIGPYNTYIFDAYQANTAADADMLVAIDAPYKVTTTTDDEGTETTTYSVDLSETYTLATGNWYTVTCNVDVDNRTVDYSVVDLSGNELTSGVLEVPEYNQAVPESPVTMFAEGLWVMTARYVTTIDIDNIEISYESSQDVANAPTIALTGVGQDPNNDEEPALNMRKYTITFIDGETLHVQAPGANEVEVEWADCDGAYDLYVTTSGTLKAWTTCGDATSEVVSTEVDCSPCVLPAAVATIAAVEEGFGKTYTLSVDNSDVPLRPTIFINYEFTPANGGEKIAEEGVASGAKVTVPSEGVLKLTTQAFGYQETTVSIDNDLEFETKTTYDFARMSKEDLTAKGFATWTVLNSSSTSGFNNWTARKRLFYNLAGSETTNDAGETVYTAVYPFGFIAEDNTVNVIDYSEIAAADNAAGQLHFEGLDVYAGHNLCAMYRIGVYNNETSGGNNKNIDVFGLDATDFVVINRINNYGGNSNHPVCATDDEYFAQLAGEDEVYRAADGALNEETGLYTVSCPVYRIDTACSKLTIFKQKGGAGIVNVVVDAADENNDPYYYTIDGLRLAQPTQPGLYIHNGKKIIVK